MSRSSLFIDPRPHATSFLSSVIEMSSFGSMKPLPSPIYVLWAVAAAAQPPPALQLRSSIANGGSQLQPKLPSPIPPLYLDRVVTLFFFSPSSSLLTIGRGEVLLVLRSLLLQARAGLKRKAGVSEALSKGLKKVEFVFSYCWSFILHITIK